MTMEIKEKFTVSYKLKEHPNAKKYPGRPSMEFGNGLLKFLSELSDEESKQLETDELVVEQEASDEFFDEIQVGDVVGLGLITGLDDVPCAYLWEITEIDHKEGRAEARDVTFESEKRKGYKGRERTLYYEDFSVGLGMGFGEILMRNNEPYGMDATVEREVIIYGDPSNDSSGESDSSDSGANDSSAGASEASETGASASESESESK